MMAWQDGNLRLQITRAKGMPPTVGRRGRQLLARHPQRRPHRQAPAQCHWATEASQREREKGPSRWDALDPSDLWGDGLEMPFTQKVRDLMKLQWRATRGWGGLNPTPPQRHPTPTHLSAKTPSPVTLHERPLPP